MGFDRLIPGLDPAPLPGPVWLFHLLWLVTFFVHLVCVNAVLGGSLLSAVALWSKGRVGRRESAAFFVGLNGWAISFAVTFGIAPLLFMQVVLGRFFYTATILVGWAWLGLLGLLTLAYYLNYLAKHRLRHGADPTLIVTIQAILFLLIAAIQVSVSLIHQQPQGWSRVAADPWSILADPTFVPRYLHFVLAAVAMAGSVLAFWSVRQATRGAELPMSESEHGPDPDLIKSRRVIHRAVNEARASFGARAALLATALQIADGFWLLFALPQTVLLTFMRAGPVTMIPLTLGILTGIGAVVVLGLAWDPMAKPRLTRHGAELIALATLIMVVTRHQVRAVYLAGARFGEHAPVAPQWGPLLLFLVLFVATLGVTAYALKRAVKDRPGPGEPAA